MLAVVKSWKSCQYKGRDHQCNMLTSKSALLISTLHQDMPIHGRVHNPGGTRCVWEHAAETFYEKPSTLQVICQAIRTNAETTRLWAANITLSQWLAVSQSELHTMQQWQVASPHVKRWRVLCFHAGTRYTGEKLNPWWLAWPTVLYHERDADLYTESLAESLGHVMRGKFWMQVSVQWTARARN